MFIHGQPPALKSDKRKRVPMGSSVSCDKGACQLVAAKLIVCMVLGPSSWAVIYGVYKALYT